MIPRSIIGKHIEIGKYGCSKCRHYIPEHYSCLLDKCIHGDKNKYIPPKKKRHRCYRCPWGKDTGGTYFCMLPRCMPKLGSFGGVKNAKQENIHQDAKELL